MGRAVAAVGSGARVAAARRSQARIAAASTPAGYLLAAQNSDGGIGATPGSASNRLYSGWAALGLAGAGENPQDVARAGRSLIDYIESGVASASDPGDVERNMLVAGAAGLPATSFGGRDLVAELRGDIRRNGSVNNQTNWTSFEVLAFRAVGVAPPPASLAWLVRQEDADGGFNFATRGGISDVDDTGAALEALARAGGSAAARARSRAVGYVRGQQDRDGGFPSMPGSGSNAQSTAFAVQGLIAAGVDPNTLHRHGAPSPLAYLRSLIAGDGHVEYSRGTSETPTWVTGEALMALEGKALPIAAVARDTATSAPGSPERSRRRHRRAVGGASCAPLGAFTGRASAPGPNRRTASGRLAGRRPARGRHRNPDCAQPGGARRELKPIQEKPATLRPPACRSESPRRRPRASTAWRSCPR